MRRVVMGLLVGAFGLVGLSGFAQAADWGGYKVGHTIMSVTIQGSVGEFRPLDILIWYPADPTSYKDAPASTYAPRLKGVTLPAPWDALSWEFAAERARENPSIKTRGHAYPLIIVSHPAVGDPFSNSRISERLASYGYIVAAPTHNGDTQDEVRIDFINKLADSTVLPCLDGLPGPCTDVLRKAMRDRALDVGAVIDNIPSLFGEHIDMSRIGFVGTSRGSATALGVAGGSTTASGWNIAAEPRVDAIFMLTAGAAANAMFNRPAITIPTVQVSGTEDRNLTTSRETIDAIGSSSKAYVVITSAWHRGLSASSYCEQMQAIGPIAQSNPNAILDRQSLQNLVLSPASGTTLDFCPYQYFVDPVDITPVVLAETGVQVTPENVPTSIEMSLVAVMASDLMRSFFRDTLDACGDANFGEYLVDEFQDKYSASLTTVELPSWHSDDDDPDCDDDDDDE